MTLSILTDSRFSTLKTLVSSFIWELSDKEVNHNEGLSVLMTQGSAREVATFNLTTNTL